ncbi:CPBP family intramembrane glutamic endopeptidase [Lawsonibacter sp. OA9]|nr:type II CAAX endopeptidase family protein [Lawsonibacter sp. OA9]
MQEDLGLREMPVVTRQDRKYFSKIGIAFFIGTLLIVAIQGVSVVLISWWKPEWLGNNTGSLLVSSLPMYLVAMPLMILIITRVKPQKVITQRQMSAGQMTVAFIMSYAILYVSNLAGTFITAIIGFLKGSGVSNVMADAVVGTNRWVIFVLMVLCAPVYEEFIFRKLLIDRTAVYGEGVAVLISGLMFGLFHGNLNQFAYAFLLGIFFAFIYVKTGRIRYTVILHMLINFLGSVVATWVMEAFDVGEMEKAVELYQNSPAEGMAAMQSVLPGIALAGGYVLLIFGIVIAGIVLLIVFRRKFRLMPGEVTIPKGKRFKTIVVNLGMLLFCGFWLVQMILQLVM